MKQLITAAGKLNLPKSRAALTALSAAYRAKAERLAATAAHAEQNGAYGLAKDLRRGVGSLKQADRYLTTLGSQANALQPYELKEAVKRTKASVHDALTLSGLTHVPPGPVPPDAATRLQAMNQRWSESLKPLEALQAKLQINPASPGESLNGWIHALKSGIRRLGTLAQSLSAGEVSVPVAIRQVRVLREDAALRAALHRAKQL